MKNTSADVVLGVDVGASSLTVVVSGEDLVPREVVEWPMPQQTRYSVDPQQNPWVLLDVLLSAVREAVGLCRVFGARVRALSINVGMHSLLALDADGMPLTSVVNYTDGRSSEITRWLAAEHGGLHALTGVPVNPASPVTKLAWFAAHDRELFDHATYWTGLKGFLLGQLTGRLVSDTSTWSANGMLDVGTLDWASSLLDLVGIRPAQLPELVPPPTCVKISSAACDYLGLPAGTPIVVGASGSATVHLGAGVMAPGSAALAMGAAAALSVVDDEPVPSESELMSSHSFADGLWVIRGAFSNGEAIARWAAESFGGLDIDALLAEAGQVPLGADGLIGIPHQTPEVLPWWNPDFRAALVGLRVEHGPAEIARAMAEGVARQLPMVRDEMLTLGRRISVIRACGTALRCPLWGELLAAALDAPLEIVQGGATSAHGAALMAWRGSGRIRCLAERPEVRLPSRTILPDPPVTAYFAATRSLAEELMRLLTRLRAVS